MKYILKRKRSFPDELPTFQQRDIIRTFIDLNESIAPAGFQFKKSDNCVLYFHLVFDDESKFPKILESIKVDYDLHVHLQYNGIPLPLAPWFVQVIMQHWKKKVIQKISQRIREIPPPTTILNLWMNLIKEIFIKQKGDHHIQYQWFGMSYIYFIRNSKRTGYYLKNFQCHLCHC